MEVPSKDVGFDLKPEDVKIKNLGPSRIDSPFKNNRFALQDSRVLYRPYFEEGGIADTGLSFEIAGPRKKVYFDPKKVKAAIVTCGGICPGLNNVVRAIVLGLYHNYGVDKIVGVRHGLQGFIPKYGYDVVEMTPERVSGIHQMGGTELGTSRGEQPIEEVVEALERMNTNLLFMIGGDGTLRAAQKIQKEIEDRGLKMAVVGIPKTIDNDIGFVSQSFGFDTAVQKATEAVRCAHVEAQASPNGVGLVKLMGRYSGFIAATAAVAQRDVNFVLIPEVDFDLEGEKGFLKTLEKRLTNRGHAVVVVAEGAGQRFFEDAPTERDESGNLRLKDIGHFLKDSIRDHFEKRKIEVNLKYIDPSYIIRSIPSNNSDNLFCGNLGQNAAHAGMAGKTGMLISIWHGIYCHVPMELATRRRKEVDLNGRLWLSVLESTGQPNMIN